VEGKKTDGKKLDAKEEQKERKSKRVFERGSDKSTRGDT
jgi:hypothetical protein